MANPRELAEQAFALLQNALSESEARASELDEELKRKRAPKSRPDEQIDVLTHRLESVEAERARWEQQAGHLEEVAEAERVKVAQLKKKLEIAESGPDKLTKKEVNFWRAKAEQIDAQIKEYQERLTALRNELNERDALIEQLTAGGGNAEGQPEPQRESDDTLRRQLEQRDAWLAELRLELHELRAQPAPPLETQAEVETLRSQIAGLERALAEAHSMRAAAQADLARTEQENDARDRAVREAAAANERTRAALVERENRLVELSAETEHLRNELRTRDENERAAAARQSEETAALSRDLEALRGRLDQDRHDMGAARAALEIALHEREHEIDRQRQLLATNERDFAELRTQLEEREQASAKARRLVEEHRVELLERDRELADTQKQVRELGHALSDREQRNSASADELEQLRTALATRDQEIDSLRETLHAANRELEHARATLTSNERELTSLRDTLVGSSRDLDELRAQKQRLETALADADTGAAELRSQQQRSESALAEARADLEALRTQQQHAETALAEANAAAEELRAQQQNSQTAVAEAEAVAAELRAQKQHLEAVLADAEARGAATRNEIDSAREQIAGLESELKEEREHAESLGELANERREHMTKLQEQVEEAEERYADANWRLGKSLYFERIVKRRKGLIEKLLAALRAKMKANTALKAGLDGLRTFKATAEMNQHKLLARIDSLKAELKEAEETVKRHQGATAAKEELTNAIARATALEERLNTQAELIQSLEADLKAARMSHKSGDDKHQELDRLTKELEQKNQIIARLQADADEQQRKLSKLRGSESETMRLKALTEKDRGEIEVLQREITQLREALARQTAAAQNSDLEAKLKERENSVTRLMGTIKEHETTIKKLNESAESWKRKYQFLATDQPDAYKNAAEN